MLGWSGSYRYEIFALPRSTASVYWMRSFVPMLKKSTSRARMSAMATAEGVSIMTPISAFSPIW